jgi:transcriptional regulator with GAF, ATPase, and Fis domain
VSVKGAFTGAIRDRAGRFEAANGGVLFLDEIGEIPLELQAKLLRVLQEKSYERVGEDRTRHANVRIVAATNRDLPREVAAGRFRQDFYYRLNVFPLTVAPLRDRKEDIPLLATHFVDLSVKEFGCARPILTRLGVEILQQYDWPGNIRELRNVIERAVILAQGGPIAFDVPVNGASIDLAALKQTSNGREEAEFLTDMNKHYTHLDLETVRRAVESITRLPGGAVDTLPAGIPNSTAVRSLHIFKTWASCIITLAARCLH